MRISDWSSDVCSSDLLHGDGFRAYWSEDLTGVEIGGAAKNVMAIGVGIADGMSLGANTRAALITRGLAEIMRLAIAMGGKAETLMRSEEHTSELQSLMRISYAVFCLKKTNE